MEYVFMCMECVVAGQADANGVAGDQIIAVPSAECDYC